jgi:hypothetical protein
LSHFRLLTRGWKQRRIWWYLLSRVIVCCWVFLIWNVKTLNAFFQGWLIKTCRMESTTYWLNLHVVFDGFLLDWIHCKIDSRYNIKDTTVAIIHVTFHEILLDVLPQNCNFKAKFSLFTITVWKTISFRSSYWQ